MHRQRCRNRKPTAWETSWNDNCGPLQCARRRLPAPGLFDRLREIERPLIMLTLEATRGNQIRAAEVLGLNRNTLRKKIRDLNIPVVRGGGR